MSTNWLGQLKWDTNGLVPAIAQDYKSGRVLMMAWVNHEALTLSVEEKRAIYWSRSRSKLWRKGEESGHVQKLHGVYLDCDGDTLIYKVEQVGGIACHTGRELVQGICHNNFVFSIYLLELSIRLRSLAKHPLQA